MAGDWIKMRTDIGDDPAVFRIATMTKLDRFAVIGRLHAFWAWSDRHSVDGRVDGASSTVVDDVTRCDGFAAALEAVGWILLADSHVEIPKHERHNGESAKERALKNDRQARWRSRRDANVDAPPSTTVDARPSTPPSTREEKRREEKKEEKKKALSGKPDDAAAILILDHLNAKTGKAFRPVRANLSLIQARLRESACPDDLKAVIDAKVSQWAGDPKMSQFLRPETLFNAQKFASYSGGLASARSPSDWWASYGFGSRSEAINAGIKEPA